MPAVARPATKRARSARSIAGSTSVAVVRSREQRGEIVRVGSEEGILEVDQPETPALHVDVPRHEVAVDEDPVVGLERRHERREAGEGGVALVRGERPTVPRLDPVLDEVLELPAREPAIEALPERRTATSGSRAPATCSATRTSTAAAEEPRRVRGRGARGGPEARVADVLDEEEPVGRGRVVVDRRDGEARAPRASARRRRRAARRPGGAVTNSSAPGPKRCSTPSSIATAVGGADAPARCRRT
jgi:hypothetical protein